MRIKDYLLSIMLYGFLVYLFSLFVDHMIDFVYQLDHPVMIGIPISLAGFLIFSEIVKRATDFNVSALHPVKISGYISAFTVLFVIVYLS